MKSYLILILLMAVTIPVLSQNISQLKIIEIDSINDLSAKTSNEKRDGIWAFTRNKKIEKIASYENGKLNGIAIYFDSTGRVLKELNFYDNALNGKSYFYSKSGKCIAIYSYIYDKKYEELMYIIDPESPPRDHSYSPYSTDDFQVKRGLLKLLAPFIQMMQMLILETSQI